MTASCENRQLGRGQDLVSRMERQAVALAILAAASFSCLVAVCRKTQPFLVQSLPSRVLKHMGFSFSFGEVVFEGEVASASALALAAAFLALRSTPLEVEEEVEAEEDESATKAARRLLELV